MFDTLLQNLKNLFNEAFGPFESFENSKQKKVLTKEEREAEKIQLRKDAAWSREMKIKSAIKEKDFEKSKRLFFEAAEWSALRGDIIPEEKITELRNLINKSIESNNRELDVKRNQQKQQKSYLNKLNTTELNWECKTCGKTIRNVGQPGKGVCQIKKGVYRYEIEYNTGHDWRPL